MKKNEKKLIFKLRDALKKAGLVIEAENVTLSSSEGTIRFAKLMTTSDITNMELWWKPKVELPITGEFHTTCANKIVEE